MHRPYETQLENVLGHSLNSYYGMPMLYQEKSQRTLALARNNTAFIIINRDYPRSEFGKITSHKVKQVVEYQR